MSDPEWHPWLTVAAAVVAAVVWVARELVREMCSVDDDLVADD